MDLPAEGRKGPIPRPPKHVTLGPAGQAWWKWAWRTPAAARWDENNDLMVVARRAHLEDVLADPEQAKAAVHAQASQIEDKLGLSPKARAQLRWRIADEARPAALEPVDNVIVSDRWSTAADAG